MGSSGKHIVALAALRLRRRAVNCSRLQVSPSGSA
jgi:hypothetical protein